MFLGYRLWGSSRTSLGSAIRRFDSLTLLHVIRKYRFRSCSRLGVFGMLRELDHLWYRRGGRWGVWGLFFWAVWLFSDWTTVELFEIYFDDISILYLDHLSSKSIQLFRPESHPNCLLYLLRGSLFLSRTRTCFFADVIFLSIGFLEVHVRGYEF